ncbi:MAG: NHL repeat-containing protein [Planctomycetota bacterium]
MRRSIHIALILVFAVFARYSHAERILVGNWGANTIREYDLSTNQFLGNLVSPGSGGLSTPDGMDFGPDGQLYVSSSDTNAILKFDANDGTFLGEFATFGLDRPGNMHFGPDGLLYVANKGQGEVVRFDPHTGEFIDVFASGGGLIQPVGLLWDGGFLYVSDFTGNSIRRFDAATGEWVDNFANVATPLIMNLDAAGNVLVSSHQDSMIWRYDVQTGDRTPALIGGPVNCPVGHVYVGDELIVASWANNRLLRYEGTGDFSQLIGITTRPNDLLLRPVPEPQGVTLLLVGISLLAVRKRRGKHGNR